MQMSMVREKAVSTFLRRIQRFKYSQENSEAQVSNYWPNFRGKEKMLIDNGVPEGWIELRKNFHTILRKGLQ